MVNYMIIEDEYFSSEELKFVLKNLRPEYNLAYVAEDVESSIAFLHNNAVDLIFSDVQLSDGTCFNIFGNLQSTIPVIYISGYKQYTEKALGLNGIAYILKPFSQEELLKVIKEFESTKAKAHSITTD